MTSVFLGGSFDPPHLGHLAMADAASRSLGVPCVTFVPAGHQPLKKSWASAEQRLAMVRAMLEGTAHQVGSWEIERPGPSYTLDTLRQIRSHCAGRLVWLVGSDVLPGLHAWKDLPGILKLADLVPLARPGHPLELPPQVMSQIGEPRASQLLSRAIVMPPRTESSTRIRQAVAKGCAPEGLHPAVESLIRAQGLYKSALQ